MEKRDLELIEEHRKTNYDLDRLFRQHLDYEKNIERLESAVGLSAGEEKELHKMKKEKLIGRDQLEKILKGLR